jgi:hypothetical protein
MKQKELFMKYASYISESIHAPEELKTSLTRRIEKKNYDFY